MCTSIPPAESPTPIPPLQVITGPQLSSLCGSAASRYEHRHMESRKTALMSLFAAQEPSTDIGDGLVDAAGEGEGGMSGESITEAFITTSNIDG